MSAEDLGSLSTFTSARKLPLPTGGMFIVLLFSVSWAPRAVTWNARHPESCVTATAAGGHRRRGDWRSIYAELGTTVGEKKPAVASPVWFKDTKKKNQRQ